MKHNIWTVKWHQALEYSVLLSSGAAGWKNLTFIFVN